MVFNSLTFVVFFALVLLLHRPPLQWTAMKVYLVHVAPPDPDFVGFEAGPAVVRGQVAAELYASHQKLQELAHRLLIGSVAEGVVRRSTVPVLLIPARQRTQVSGT